MARHKSNKFLRHKPKIKGFKPFGIKCYESEKVYILPEEYEVMRLLDYNGLTQEEASVLMKVSRPTITRIYQSFREKVAKAFIENCSVLFEKDSEKNIYVDEYYCSDCKQFFDVKSGDNVKHCIFCGSENIILKKSINMRTINFEHGFGGGRGRGSGKGLGKGRFGHHDENNRNNLGPEGYCICVKCGSKYEHIPGTPCKERRCEKCGTALVREGSEHHRLILEKLKKKQNNEGSE